MGLVLGRIYSGASSNPFDCYRFTAWTDDNIVIRMESSKPDSEDDWWIVMIDKARGNWAQGPMNKERAVWHFAREIGAHVQKTQERAVFNSLCEHPAFRRESSMYLHGYKKMPNKENK